MMMSSPRSADPKVSMIRALAGAARGVRLERTQVVGLVLYHALALLAFAPWFFSWTGVVLAVLGIYVFGVLGINIGYHRLLTHKGFVCPKWLERGFAVLGVCCLQGSPSRWVATHRRHHEHADDEPDPHSPIIGFLWAHVGWVLVKNETMERDGLYRSYAKDILRDDFYAWIEDRKMWIWLVFMSWGVFFCGGLAAGLALGWPLPEAAQFGLSMWLWGVIVRTVVHCHFTWAVNSITHMWGQQPKQRVYRLHQQWRGLAQQSSCRSPFGTPRAPVVGGRRGLVHHPVPDGGWTRYAGQNARFAGPYGPRQPRLALA
jgi:stearoyl-CoA desaturase (delta-9 desaturase)